MGSLDEGFFHAEECCLVVTSPMRIVVPAVQLEQDDLGGMWEMGQRRHCLIGSHLM